ncbi:hypothetical protein CC1G_13751 [Coprinopsis cinerea okayama7|uniref:Uncharacterized protein n=1 Tax=Coprinopsis cinerea (strain Okayama-7 / 130 / ATCC MYA-4618 / FGSC 9003) TaxID=240176 RepID=D6RK79_COPC7|nr:hypothetical protein CC1G_13751 [Coprinopsis cinerea okayama7\|eukprot:XP_002912219.1 hypothetical protein CC1G_13751 [Coprinopsis cinerea okayama7\
MKNSTRSILNLNNDDNVGKGIRYVAILKAISLSLSSFDRYTQATEWYFETETPYSFYAEFTAGCVKARVDQGELKSPRETEALEGPNRSLWTHECNINPRTPGLYKVAHAS